MYSAPFRAKSKARELEKKELGQMPVAKMIEPAQREWASRVVYVPKTDGVLRFCLDYWKLNCVTVTESYPVPSVNECIDSSRKAQVNSTLDTNSHY